MKAVSSQSASTVPIYQYPLFASSVEKTAAWPGELVQLFTGGVGYESRLVTTFNSQYSTQIRRVPLFLEESTMGEAHFVCADLTMFLFSILSFSVVSNLQVFEPVR